MGLAPPSPGIQGLNQYRFSGKEFQADLGLNWNHQDARFLNVQNGPRWLSVDPDPDKGGQESWSPYQFGFANAVRYQDADGHRGGPPNTGGVGLGPLNDVLENANQAVRVLGASIGKAVDNAATTFGDKVQSGLAALDRFGNALLRAAGGSSDSAWCWNRARRTARARGATRPKRCTKWTATRSRK